MDIQVTEQVKDLVSVGKGVFGIRRVDSQVDVYYIEARDHIIIDGIDRVFKLYSVQEKNTIRYYILRQSFFP